MNERLAKETREDRKRELTNIIYHNSVRNDEIEAGGIFRSRNIRGGRGGDIAK